MSEFPQGITAINTALSVGVFLGVTLFVYFIVSRSQRNYANNFLAFLMLVYTSFLLPTYLFGARLLEHLPHLTHSGVFLFPLLGPLIYFYTRASVALDFRLRSRDLVHLVPFLFFLIVDGEVLLMKGPAKYQTYLELVEYGRYPFSAWTRYLKLLITVGYFVFSVQMIFRYRRHTLETASSVDKDYFRWLLFFSLGLLTPLLVSLVINFSQFSLVPGQVLIYSFVFFIVVVYLGVLFRPNLFRRFPNQMEGSLAGRSNRKRYEGSRLGNNQKDEMVTRLVNYVEKEKPYLSAELTLGQLAEQVDIPSHYLSQVINEKLGMSFVDFINGYRIERAKSLLVDDGYSHYTIIATAYASGFNSKSAFYEAFRKNTGTTPSKFRKGLIIN